MNDLNKKLNDIKKNLNHLSENKISNFPQTYNLLKTQEPQTDKIDNLRKKSRKFSCFLIHIQIFLMNFILRLAQNLKLIHKISNEIPIEIITLIDNFSGNKNELFRGEDKLREITQVKIKF